LLHNYGCRKCNGKTFRDVDEMKKYIKESTLGEYELLSNHCKTRDKAIFKHNSENCRGEDGIFEMKIHGFITLKHRCPYCNKGSKGLIKSAGIIKIEEYLNKENIAFQNEYTFKDCISNNNKNLFYDIFIPEYNILIEYDGIQHFKPVKYFGGEEVFKKTVENDNIKDEFAKKKGIKLIRIPYTDFSKINEILDLTFNEYRNGLLEEISKSVTE
jgi:hypothetical protein